MVWPCEGGALERDADLWTDRDSNPKLLRAKQT